MQIPYKDAVQTRCTQNICQFQVPLENKWVKTKNVWQNDIFQYGMFAETH